MIHGDEADIAGEFESREREAALARMRSMILLEDPDEDANGRYCLDCGEVIPPERVEAVHAVRCVFCAGQRERGHRAVGRSCGIRQYLRATDDAENGGE